VCKHKADTYAALLYSPRLTASDLRIFHKAIYTPTMRYEYCLPALSVNKVQSKIILAMLRKMHLAGNLPTSIRHGSLALGGLDIFDMRTEMGIENLKFLRNAVFSKSAAGDLILMNLQYRQLEAGIGECLLEHPSISIPYLTSTWLTSVWQYMANHNLSITITDQPSLRLSGRQDQFIMQSSHLVRYSHTQQRDINDTTDSTRSELCGFASSFLLIATLSRTWGLRHTCTFRWLTDSKSAISKIERTTRLGAIAVRQPFEVDLLSLIKRLIRDIRQKISFNWIKGHQDDLRSYSTLPRSVQLNIDADFLATRYRVRGKLRPSPQVEHIPEQRISICINGVRVTSQYDACIHYHVNGYHLRRYMQDKKKWLDKTWEDINFDLFGSHFRRLEPAQQIKKIRTNYTGKPFYGNVCKISLGTRPWRLLNEGGSKGLGI
jgi:hypothetical protein